MSPKIFQFLCFCWFTSTLICLILEGSYFGASQYSVINSLTIIQQFKIPLANITVPVFNTAFLGGIVRMLLWDYSFYSGGWVVVRWFWMIVLDPGIIWGIIQSFIWLYGQAISLLRLTPGV